MKKEDKEKLPSEVEKIIEMVSAVGSLPPSLFKKYKESGRSVEDVYKEISNRN